MDKRSLVIYLSGLAAAGAVVALAASCSDQPRIKCTAGHGPSLFAAVYTGGPPCLPAGEPFGVEAYNYALPDGTNLDPNHGSLGMESTVLNDQVLAHPPSDDPALDLSDRDTNHKKWSLGDWLTPEPDGTNFCTVKDPYDTEQVLKYRAAVPPDSTGDGGVAAIRAYSAKYHWKNPRFYNTPSLPGTQLVADLDLTITEGLEDGGAGTPCTGSVHVVGLWPQVDCAADDPADTDGLDETKCSPEADNSKGRPTGSGISPDLKTVCHPVLHWCVLPGEPQTL